MPYRLPSGPKITPLEGFAPPLPWLENSYSGVISQPEPVGFSLNTVPTELLPPVWAVPYRFPARSKVRPASGSAPSPPPVKVCRTVKVWARAEGTIVRSVARTVKKAKATLLIGKLMSKIEAAIGCWTMVISLFQARLP